MPFRTFYVYEKMKKGRYIMQKDSKIYVVGHKGMVGSAIIRKLIWQECDGLLCCQNSGINVATAMNGGKYEKVYFVNKGVNDTGKTVQMI